MKREITIILRYPEQIRPGLETARQLAGRGNCPKIVFLCPECASRQECRACAETVAKPDPGPCYTDHCGDCIPSGFQPVAAARIARLIRDADFVVPLP